MESSRKPDPDRRPSPSVDGDQMPTSACHRCQLRQNGRSAGRRTPSKLLLSSITCLVLALLLSSTFVDAQRPRNGNSRPASAKRRADSGAEGNGASVATTAANNNNSNNKPTSQSAATSPTPSSATAAPKSNASSTPGREGDEQQLEQTSAIGDVKKMNTVKSVPAPPPTFPGGQQLSKRTGEQDEIDEDEIDGSATTTSRGDAKSGKEKDSEVIDSRLSTSLSDDDVLNRPNSWVDRTAYARRLLNMTRVDHIEAECQDDFMKIFIRFNGTFDGLIYSSGYSTDPDCIYINGSTAKTDYEFFIQLNRCGTLGGNNHDTVDRSRNEPSKSFMWNTVTIQYNNMIEEEWDEHFKVTCEYGYDFWKTVTFPVVDVEVATGNSVVFTLTPPECLMEIRNGYGISGNKITGPVRVGDPLTLVISMKSQHDGFDMVVNNCFAHNGGQKRIPLIDRFGCPVDEKLISSFQGTWTNDGIYETQVYAYMKAFRFTGSPALYLECEVRMCHGFCPSQPCHWRTLGRKKREALALPDGSRGTDVKNVRSKTKFPAHSSPYNSPGFQRKSRFTYSGEGIEVDDALLEQGGASGANFTTISLFQALQVLKDVDEEPSLPGSAESDEDRDYSSKKTDSQRGGFSPDSENVCIRSGVFTALLGICGLLILLMGTACCFLFVRTRRSMSAMSEKIEPHDFIAPRRRLR